jgi:hypothetical protein
MERDLGEAMLTVAFDNPGGAWTARLFDFGSEPWAKGRRANSMGWYADRAMLVMWLEES